MTEHGRDEPAGTAAGSDPTDDSAGATDFPVVALGGSAGALHSLQEFFGAMPADSGCAFVVITHQHPGRKSLLPELLQNVTSMPVSAARHGLRVEPDHVYVAVPDGQVSIDDGLLTVDSKPGPPDAGTPDEGHSTRAAHHPIDAFFRALSAERRERAIAVVLSGSGADGSIGLKDIKAESGLVLVEQPETAEFDSMPLAALRTHLVDDALPIHEIPLRIADFVHARVFPEAAEAIDGETGASDEEAKNDILAQLRERCGHDFSGYKDRTIHRRIQRRIGIRSLQHERAYADFLHEHPQELDILFREIIVSVTRFFRDPDAWHALASALRTKLETMSEDDALRAWVVGCASGEEAYTLAIVANECVSELERHIPIQVFATDLEPKSIETARAGEYPAGIENDVPPELLAKYFVRLEDHYRVRKSLRERVVFAVQNVTQDPPFTRMDVIACRNVLIYMDNDLQQKVVPVLHYALRSGGLLLLGSSETVSRDRYGHSFEAVDRGEKLYRRSDQAMPGRPLPQLPFRPTPRGRHDEPRPPEDRRGTFGRTIERILLDRYAPASAVINERGEAAYFHGRTGRYLEPAAGVPGNNVLDMAREGLRPALSDALRTAVADEQQGVTYRQASVRTNGGFEHTTIQISRIDAPESVRGLLLVSLQPTPEPTRAPPSESPEPASETEDNRVARLEREFEAVTAEKRWTVEQLESTNEDLQSANEELQSTNEELQSSNEELETSKEEMESLNEELSAVNSELQEKIHSLEQANNDMNNMLNSTEIAILFLSRELEVRRFTEKVRDLISLRESDIGRPVSELASNLQYDALVEDAEAVLRTVQTREIDFQTKSGQWSRMRMMPYWTIDQRVDGVVCTFIGIDETKRAEQGEAYFKSIVQTLREPLLVLDSELRILYANSAFYRTFDLDAAEVEDQHIYSLAGGEWDTADLRRLLEEILPRNRSLADYEVSADFDRLGHKRLMLNARQLERDPDAPDLILLAIEDVTNQSA
ncbi:MAG: CheR family methyltransferase [Halofilum sp. (in: g-proteobacteria)]